MLQRLGVRGDSRSESLNHLRRPQPDQQSMAEARKAASARLPRRNPLVVRRAFGNLQDRARSQDCELAPVPMKLLIQSLSVAIGVFTLWEVNYPMLTPKGKLAVFALLGIVICFLENPLHKKVKDKAAFRAADLALAALTALCCGYVVVQTEPLFQQFWSGGAALGDRAGVETSADFLIGGLGILLVLEVTRRSIGWALPILAAAFIAYAWLGPSMPDWLFPHRGYSWNRIVSTTFLQSQGVFGIAMNVMFTYVYLFVVFGGFLEATGATQFIIDLARRIFSKSTGGPAKVSVLSSGLMGSLSGSAVANTAATGTFTIPMMRTSGFEAHVAGGISAAASSGGALMPPIMGAGAYMMLEIIDPPVTYLEIIRAALLPAILYYVSLLLICHFYAKTVQSRGEVAEPAGVAKTGAGLLEGSIFFGSLGVLILLLVVGYTPFRAVTLSMGLIYVMRLPERADPHRAKAALAGLRQVRQGRGHLGRGSRLRRSRHRRRHVDRRRYSLRGSADADRPGQPDAGVGPHHDCVDRTRNGTAVGGLLLAAGDDHRPAVESVGRRAAGGPHVHLLLRHDVHGHAAGGPGGLYRGVDRQGAHHGDLNGGFPFRSGRVLIALRLRRPAAAFDAGRRRLSRAAVGDRDRLLNRADRCHPPGGRYRWIPG